MASTSDLALSGLYNIVTDFRADNTGAADASGAINAAIIAASQNAPANGIVLAPPGTFLINNPIRQKSNVTIEGAGPGATTFILGPSLNRTVLQNDDQVNGNTALIIRNLTIDGNRANQTSQVGEGISFVNVTQFTIENVVCKSAEDDGLHLDTCQNFRISGVTARDNGNNGYLLSNCQNYRIVAPQAYDNCKVTTAGNADGIHLTTLTTDGTITDVIAYDSAGGNKRQGYGVREVASTLCDRNLITMPTTQWSALSIGNRTGSVSLDGSSSMSIVGTQITKAVIPQTANYTATLQDQFIPVSAVTAAVTITLPTAVGFPGLTYTVKKLDASANSVTIATTSSQTIDTSSTFAISTQYGTVTVVSDGSNWQRTAYAVISGAPSGSAGGSLAGTYPNPTFAAGANLLLAVTLAPSLPYAILTTDNFITTSGTGTLTLPTAVGVTGKVYTVKKTDAGTTTTIATTSSQTIDGATTATITLQNTALSVISDGSNWQVT